MKKIKLRYIFFLVLFGLPFVVAAIPFCGIRVQFDLQEVGVSQPMTEGKNHATYTVTNSGVFPTWYREVFPGGLALGAIRGNEISDVRVSKHQFAPWKKFGPGESVTVSEQFVDLKTEKIGIQLCDWMGRRRVFFDEPRKHMNLRIH